MPVVGRRAATVVELTAGYGPAMVAPVGSPPDRDLRGRAAEERPGAVQPRRAADCSRRSSTRASAVLELARAQQRERQLRLQADRDRIARDLHDHVVQRIFATALSLDRLSRSLAQDEPEAAARLSAERGRARRHDRRDPDGDLRAAAGRRPGALDRPAPADRRRPSGDRGPRPPARRPVPRRGRPAAAASSCPDLVAVVRELVTNVVRHADAQRVTVTVTAGDEIRVTVTDDGCGLPPVTVRSGLANLADRAERRGGRFSIRHRRARAPRCAGWRCAAAAVRDAV